MEKRKILIPVMILSITVLLSSCVGLLSRDNDTAPSYSRSNSTNRSTSDNSSNISPSSFSSIIAEMESLLKDPDLVYGILPNGMRYVIQRNTTPADRVSMHLNVQAGSMQETDAQRGLAHYLEHMLFNGSTHFKPGELIEYFQSIGMMFGADANAHTGFFETVYDILLPTGERQDLEKGLLVLQDYAQGALLLESEVDRERGVILAEKRERDSVSFRTFKESLGFELPDSRIARRLPIGIEEVIETADRNLLKSYYDTWYRPETMMIVMVGDFDPAVAEELIQSRFSQIQARADLPTILEDHENRWTPHTGEKSFYHYEPEAGNTEVSIGTLVWAPFETETEVSLKKRVLHRLADMVVQNRLSESVRKGDVPFSDAGIYSGRFLRNVQYSGISAECEPDEWEESLVGLEKTLRQALSYGFTASEVNRVKADFVLGLETAVKEAGTRKSTPLARQLISSVNRKRVVMSPSQELALLRPYVKTLTPAVLADAFQKSWSQPHRLVQVTGNAVIRSEDLILSIYRQSKTEQVAAIEEKDAPKFPYLPMPKVAQKGANNKSAAKYAAHGAEGRRKLIQNDTMVDDLGIRMIQFTNGVRLNIKKTDFKQGELIFQANFGRGKASEPKKKPGLAMVTEAVMDGSGVGRLTVDELSAALAGRNVDVEFSVDDGEFSFSGSAAPDEIALLFQLLYTRIMDPGFRSEALTLFKSRYSQMFQEIPRTPDGMMKYKGERFLAGGDSRFGMPEMEEIDALTLADVEAWIKPALGKSDLEISVVGDLDVDDVIANAADWLVYLPRKAGMGQAERKKGFVGIGVTNAKCAEKKRDKEKPGRKQSVKRVSKDKYENKSRETEYAYSKSQSARAENAHKMSPSRRPVFPVGKTIDLPVESRLDKGMVLMAFPTDDFWNIKQTRRLNILAKLFSERLRKTLREELGATYSPYAYNHASQVYDGYGLLRGVVNISPERVQDALGHMEEIADALAKDGVEQNELDLVLEPILTYIKDMVRTNSYWLDSVLAGSGAHPEKLKWAETIMADYRSISVEDIALAASRFMKRNRAARIIIQPSPE